MTILEFPQGTPTERAAKADLPEVWPAEQPITESEIAELHSGAFRDLEGEVCDLDRMGNSRKT